ncbi:DUF3307 domain-containing protein [Desertivirga xinjiangensis]|uniref:DUF3307 domain-containing protein n=1 Tax=Desertivirga xinjiangensis TaxID=539206 RepID=UPI002109FC57|nr:DUF3307 domain-containing protein [Pedobacter xinjiangensis]
MDIFLIKLLIAHFLGDFFLQPDSWVVEKEAKKLRSLKLYLHVLIHGGLVMLLLADLNYWRQAVAILVLHGLIDTVKLLFQRSSTKRTWFFADQVLHLISILAVWYLSTNPVLSFDYLSKEAFWIAALGILFLSYPTSLIIKTLIAKWTPNYLPTQPAGSVASLQSAGKYIGMMERLLVLLFVYTNHWEAVGFLIAAKSIFRFGDLKEGNDLKLTEYILIGTFLSFGIAIVVGMVCVNLV